MIALLIGTVIFGIATFPKATAASPFFSTGPPDGLMGMASRPSNSGNIEIEAADDFILSSGTTINSGTFIGLIPIGVPLSDVNQVRIEIYRVFPLDSVDPPSGNVPTRTNSPSDNALDERDSAVVGDLSFTTTLLSDSFSVANTVVNGIHPIPNQFTGGEGPATGQEVLFTVTLTKPFNLNTGHYFFVPQVQLSTGDFLWLSAPKPITGGTGPFTPDLQTWIRNANLAPDWLRVGTDITHSGPFNGAFSLTGTSSTSAVPEFPLGSFVLFLLTLPAVLVLKRRYAGMVR